MMDVMSRLMAAHLKRRRQENTSRKPRGRWAAVVLVGGVFVAGRRCAGKTEARAFLNRWRALGISNTVTLLRRFHAKQWRRIGSWEAAMRRNAFAFRIEDVMDLIE